MLEVSFLESTSKSLSTRIRFSEKPLHKSKTPFISPPISLLCLYSLHFCDTINVKKKVGKKMRLNSDCIRDLLLTVELVSDGHKQFLISPDDFDEVFDDAFELFSSYNEEELTYHVRQCDKAGLLSGVKFPADGGFVFCDLTPKGHWFLNTIRPKSVWEKLTSAGHATLPFLLDMASSLSIEVLKSIIPSIRL